MRGTVRRMCRACYAEFVQDRGVQGNVGSGHRKVQLPHQQGQF